MKVRWDPDPHVVMLKEHLLPDPGSDRDFGSGWRIMLDGDLLCSYDGRS